MPGVNGCGILESSRTLREVGTDVIAKLKGAQTEDPVGSHRRLPRRDSTEASMYNRESIIPPQFTKHIDPQTSPNVHSIGLQNFLF